MTYRETVDWMFSRLPMYQRKGSVAYKKDLKNTTSLCNLLGNPQNQFTSIHVGGTNGKGSTSHMLSSILQEAGYKVGLYTSPHLKNFTERIRINGKEISRDFVTEFVMNNKMFLEQQKLSFFEMTVGLAFDYFAKRNVDIAVIEVGLGGRLDSTNVVLPKVSVITNIGHDHMQFLGETLSEIAFEKAGIIKENTPVVIGERQAEVAPIFIDKSSKMNASISFASDNEYSHTTDLLGSYQKNNIRTAVRVIEVLEGFQVSKDALERGLKNVVRNTNFKGRWEILREHPIVICDTAHNKEGLQYVMNQLADQKFNKLHVVLGVVNDKRLDHLLPFFPIEAHYYFCKPNIPRGLDQFELHSKAQRFNLTGNAYSSVNEAYLTAISEAQKEDAVFVGGSTFVVAEVL